MMAKVKESHLSQFLIWKNREYIREKSSVYCPVSVIALSRIYADRKLAGTEFLLPLIESLPLT